MAKIKLDYVNEYVDRTGKVRRYFRKGGKRLGPLPGKPGSTEFMAAYQAYLAEQPVPVKPKAEGSFGYLVAEFYGSALFTKNLKQSSQRLYRKVLDPLAREHGHRAVALMTREAVERIINRIGLQHPAMGNLTRAVLRRLMGFAVKRGLIPQNPAAGLESFKTGEHHTWTEAELRQFESRWPLGTRERLAYALLLHTTQRIGDVAKMHRRDIIDGTIHVVQEKTDAELHIPIAPELAEALRAYPARGLTLIGSLKGVPMTVGGVESLMKRAIVKAGLPKRCVPHGLRKASMRRMAESGATEKQIASFSGHKTLREIERYTKAADQKKLARAGLAKLQDRKANLGD
jgi:integrase